MQHGSPFKVIELDVSNLDERNDKYTYTDEEAKERYGPQEGQEFGPDVQICGCRLPKQRAVKFATLCGAHHTIVKRVACAKRLLQRGCRTWYTQRASAYLCVHWLNCSLMSKAMQ